MRIYPLCGYCPEEVADCAPVPVMQPRNAKTPPL